MNKIKYYLQKIRTAIILSSASLVMTPVGVSATGKDVADLLNTKLTNDGLNVPGAPTGNGGGTDGIVKTFNTFMDQFKVIITGVTGILAMVMVGLFVWKCFEFAKSSSNPSARANAVTGIIVFLIAAALFGSASLFVGLAYGVFI